VFVYSVSANNIGEVMKPRGETVKKSAKEDSFELGRRKVEGHWRRKVEGRGRWKVEFEG
jgi:predicted secreted protein